jgi:hypothetical protein
VKTVRATGILSSSMVGALALSIAPFVYGQTTGSLYKRSEGLPKTTSE